MGVQAAITALRSFMRSDGIVNDNARVSTYGPFRDTQSDQLRALDAAVGISIRGKGDWRTALSRGGNALISPAIICGTPTPASLRMASGSCASPR